MTTSSSRPTSLEWRDAETDALLMISLLMPEAPFPDCPLCARPLATHSWVRVDLSLSLFDIYRPRPENRLSMLIADCSNDAREGS